LEYWGKKSPKGGEEKRKLRLFSIHPKMVMMQMAQSLTFWRPPEIIKKNFNIRKNAKNCHQFKL
jgi:hypothetical protein